MCNAGGGTRNKSVQGGLKGGVMAPVSFLAPLHLDDDAPLRPVRVRSRSGAAGSSRMRSTRAVCDGNGTLSRARDSQGQLISSTYPHPPPSDSGATETVSVDVV